MSGKSFQVSIDFIGNIGDLQSKIKQISSEINKIGTTSGGAAIQKQFEQLTKTVTDLQTKASQPIGSKGEFNKLVGEVSKVEMTYNQLIASIERLQSASGKKLLELLPKSERDNIEKAKKALEEYGQAKKEAEKIKDNNANYHKLVGNLKVAENEAKNLAEALQRAAEAKNAAFTTKKGGASQIAKEYKEAADKIREMEEQRKQMLMNAGFMTGTKKEAEEAFSSGETEEIKKAAEQALIKYKELSQEIKKAKEALNETKGGKLVKTFEDARGAAKKAEKEVATLSSKLKELKLPEDSTQKLEQAFEKLKNKAIELGVNVKDIDNSAQVDVLLQRLNQLESDGFVQGAQAAQQYATTLRQTLGGALEELRKKTDGMSAEFGSFMSAQEDMSMLQNRLKYFFSLANSIQLFKRVVSGAVNTIKELDKVMTETAVVTDFTVGDMWEKLPEYSSKASALGASIKDMYAATTLYYQQGLNTEAAMSVGVETMKMARIAGMDAADATTAMTAALRGFNMEVNQLNAQRVNDVYSELAAITAADTNQIATAMSKTASIANSANMEFETTAALLAQIIETTQEAPETAGTAMKTIIARFTEVKQLFSEGMLSGEDEEGEEININKIDAALKSVGISLKDFLNGSKGIDDIFLELASKWDTLDLATQRYIATTAAGSRQQSRFIAMMSNYDRTMELVSAANNSAGASQQQFDKTLESVEAKLQKLSNAWNEFTMGIANSSVIKGAIDLLTRLLETINNLTSSLSGNGGLVKSFMSLAVIGGALGVGKNLLARGFQFAGQSMGISGAEAKFAQTPIFTNPLQFNQIGKNRLMYAPVSMFGTGINEAINKYGEKQKVKVVKKQGSPLQTQMPQKPIQEKLSPKEQAIMASAQKGQLASAATTGIGILATGLSTVARNNGNEKLANGLQIAGTGFIGLGQGIGFVNQSLVAAGTTWSKFLPVAKSAAVAMGPWAAGLAAVAAAAYALYKVSPEGQLKDAEKRTKQVSQGAKQAADSYDNLKSSLESIGKQEKELENMTYGTDEWRQATAQLNQETLNLIEENSALSKYVTRDANGVLRIAEEGKAQALEIEAKEKLQAESAKLNAELIEEKLRKDTITSSDFMGMFQGAFKTIYNQDGTAQKVRDETANRELADAIVNGVDGRVFSTAKELQDYADERGIEINVTDDVFSKLKDYGFARQAQDMKISESERLVVENIKAIAENKGTLDEFSENLDEDIISNMRDKEYNPKSWEERLSREDYKRYAEMMGYKDYSGRSFIGMGKAQFIDGEGKVQKINTRTIKEALAAADADSAVADKIGKIDDFVETVGGDVGLMSQALSQDGKNLTSTNLQAFEGLENKKYAELQESGELDSQMEIIQEALGVNLQDLATATGVELETLFNTIVENVQSGSDRITDERKDLVQSMNKYSNQYNEEGRRVLNESASNADLLRDMETKYGEEFRDTLDGVFSTMMRSGDDAVVSSGYLNFIGLANKKDTTWEEVQELANYINEINWANPIEAASQLNETLKTGSNIAKGFAQTVLSSNAQFFGAGSQMQFFLQSEDFSEAKGEINEIIELQGELDASNVLDLAKSYKSLSKMLDNTKISAGGVAKALTAVADGKIGVQELTNNVMQALSQIDSLGSMIANLNDKLSDFDAGTSEKFGTEFLGQAYQTISENISAGAFGDTQTDKYLSFLFGDNWSQGKTGQEQIALQKKYSSFLEKNQENMASFWGNLAQGKNEIGAGSSTLTRDEKTGAYQLGEGMSLKLENGEIKFDYNGLNADQQAETLAKTLGITKELAEIALTDLKRFSTDYASSMRGKEKEEVLNGLIGENEAGKLVDQSEIDTIKQITGYDLTEDVKNRSGFVTNYYDKETGQLKTKETGLYEELAKANNYINGKKDSDYADGGVAEVQKKLGITTRSRRIAEIEELLKDEDPTSAQYSGMQRTKAALENGATYSPKIDLKEMEKGLADLNLPPEAATQMAQDFVNGLENGDKATIEFQASDGSMQSIKVGAGESVQAAMDQVELQIKNDSLAESINKAFQNKPIPVELSPNAEDIEGQEYSVKLAPTLTENEFNGSINLKPILTMTGFATGVKNSPHTLDAMVGEEGPELIERQDGTAYLSGLGGPEITRINKGDTVHTAEETEKIFKRNSGYTMPRFSDGKDTTVGAYGGLVSSNSNSKKTGDTGEKANKANTFDRLYNILEAIEKLTRDREKIERRYQRLLERRVATAKELYQASKEEADALREQAELQKQVIDGRQKEMQTEMDSNKDLQKYATIDKETGVITIDWDAINKVKSESKQKEIQDYIKKLEELRDSMREAEDALEDINDSLYEIEERNKEEYLEFEDRVKDAVIAAREKEIEVLEGINDSINDTNANLLSAVQKSVDKIRQDRQNEETEKDLGEKQRELAYLQQDTSGANDLRILELQEELREGRQDYTDSLIDQKISELQEQNDEAAKQREKQITLLQNQLDADIESGRIWKEVGDLMVDGLSPSGELVIGSRLDTLLKEGEAWDALSEKGKMEWLTDTNMMIAQAVAYMMKDKQLEKLSKSVYGKTITFTNASGETLTGKVNEKGDVVLSDGSYYSEVYQWLDGTYHTVEEQAKPGKEAGGPGGTSSSGSGGTSNSSNSSTEGNKTSYVYKTNKTGNNTYSSESAARSAAEKAVEAQYNKMADNKRDSVANGEGGGSPSYLQSELSRISNEKTKALREIQVSKVKAYKTGGLADFTGPAWLDGTKSKPELVLNQRDTQNFIQLKDILSSIMSRGFASRSTPTENNGDITYDIDINVETMRSDYDVEQVANKIKTMINEDARYRNNNAISLKR